MVPVSYTHLDVYKRQGVMFAEKGYSFLWAILMSLMVYAGSGPVSYTHLSIPTGELVPVEETPMDFRKEKAIGQDIEADYEALNFGRGYDHTWVIDGSGMRLSLIHI